MTTATTASTASDRDVRATSTRFRITPREKDVLLLLCDGFTTKQIASTLGISPKTVEFHKARLAVNAGTRGLAQLVRFAVRNGFIEP